MRINALSQSIQSEIRKIESAKKSDKIQNTIKSLPEATDHSQISDSARQLSNAKSSIDTITATLSVQDDIRSEKIIEVREKIKNGYYDSPDFIDKLADKLLAEFGVKPSP